MLWMLMIEASKNREQRLCLEALTQRRMSGTAERHVETVRQCCGLPVKMTVVSVLYRRDRPMQGGLKAETFQSKASCSITVASTADVEIPPR